MKEPYISPRLQLLCFEPCEAISSDFWGEQTQSLFALGSDVSGATIPIEEDPEGGVG